jgi:hypothetical protein
MRNKLNGTSWYCFLFLLLPVLLYVSCSGSPRHNTTNTGKDNYDDTIRRKPPGSFSDTIVIGFPAAVFYNPDSLQLKKIEAVIDTMIFEGTMHDYFYQMRNARIVLKKYYPLIKITDVKNARYLLFEKANGNKECIDLNTQNDPCGIFIFDGYKKAQLVDMMNIDSELSFYFSK